MRSPRRRVLRAWPALVAALAGSLLGYQRWFAPVPARTATVVRGTIVREVRGVGRLESPSEVSLGFDVPGRIVTVTVDQGARVRAGDVLARLDQDDATALLSIAQASRSVSSTGVQTARAEVARAQAALAQARIDARRATELFGQGALTAAEHDAVASRLAIAEADWRVRNAASEQAARQVSVASGSVALQQVRIDRGVLRSPIDGIVLVRHREPGDVVATGVPVLTVAASDRLLARVWVDESALSVLAAGQAARIELRSEPGRSFAAVVERIAPEADRETHEVLVDVAVRDLPARYAIGQRADAWVAVQRAENVLRVSRAFCDVRAGTCTVDRSGSAVVVPVRFGLDDGEVLEARAGLVAGDVLVAPLRAGASLASGRRITVGGAR